MFRMLPFEIVLPLILHSNICNYFDNLFLFPQVSTDNLRIRLDFSRCAFGNLASEIKGDNPVGDVHHHAHVVLHQHDTAHAVAQHLTG